MLMRSFLFLFLASRLVMASAVNEAIFCFSATNCPFVVAPQVAPIVGFTATETSGAASIGIAGDASVDAVNGIFREDASYTSVSASVFYQYQTASLVNDTFTVNAPGLSGQIGSLDLIFGVSGTDVGSALGEISAFIQDPAGGMTVSSCPVLPSCFFAGSATVDTGPLAFHYGTPFTLSYTLGAVTFPRSGDFSSSADYAHTGQLLGWELFDAGGNPVSLATVSAPGGEVVNLLTPEPGSALVVLAALGALGLGRRKARTRS